MDCLYRLMYIHKHFRTLVTGMHQRYCIRLVWKFWLFPILYYAILF